ncbi:MAG TPA: transporter substrate-binding domain-containing protein [Xanthomonadaceae bacterium]|nr:transporter substrate-binding domain-containing protein [Xanthomonadaceae bacterium]
MGWDPWEPYHFEDIDGSVRGIEVDMVQTIAAGAGCRVKFVRGDWATLLRQLRDGDVQILGSATATPEREEIAMFSAPYRDESFRLYVRADEAREYEGDSLAALIETGMRLGVTLGYVYSEEVTTLQDREDLQAQFVESPEAEFNFVALAEHHVDGVLEDPNVASAIIRRRGWQDQIEMHPIDLGSSEVSFMFSRASVDEELVERFNRSLAALRTSGEIDRIIARYRID